MRRKSYLLISVILITVLLGYSTSASDQASKESSAQAQATLHALPAEWDGLWKGSLTWIKSDGKKQEFGMELRVASVPGGNAKTWRITYTGQPERPYEISPVAGEAGHFVIDEKNGLLIDSYLTDKVLYSMFLVSENFISTRFENRGDQIQVELTTFIRSSPRQTKTTGGDFEVSAYRFGSVQRGILKRQ